MKRSSTPVLSSLLIVGLQASTSPALCDQAAVESAEASVKTFEARVGTSNPSYTGQLMYLAGIYQANGMYKEADATFAKAIDSCKSRSDGYLQVPHLMLNWAMALASPHRGERKASDADLKKAEKILQNGLALANALPTSAKERSGFLLDTVNFYRVIESKSHEQERLKAADGYLQALEKKAKLGNAEIIQVACDLIRMSNLYCQAPPPHIMKRIIPVEVVSDNAPDKPNTVKAKNFKTAAAYQLRAIAQYDRLPDTVPSRIEAHRSLIIWYRYFGQAKQADFQTQQLNKLMKTTDKAKLFPEPPQCLGCGMG